jgi:cutinase
MAEHQLPKLNTGVRFPSPAPHPPTGRTLVPVTRPAAILVLALLVVGLPAPALADESCANVTIIGVAGSGQGGGTGPQVEEVSARAAQILSAAGRTTTIVALDYPAIDLARTLGFALFDGRYRESVDLGAASLTASIAARSAECPDTVLVLIGYSQGAQVVRESMASIPLTIPIAAVALLADPTASLVDDVVRLGGARSDDGSLGGLALPLSYQRRTVDVCAAGDVFCGGGRLVIGAHSRGYGTPLSDRAASRIAVLASSAVASRSGVVRPTAPWLPALIR